ncbi:hypothetical protein KKC13_11595 [bacterium]|nr:hypothetical protein [bacterium]MBU1957903.1 hypothetical protein [bacterium]
MKHVLKNAHKIVLILFFSILVIGCGSTDKTKSVDGNNVTSDITITLSFSEIQSKIEKYEKVTEISYVTLDVNSSATQFYIKDKSFIKDGSEWTITLSALPTYTLLTFTAKAYSSSGVLLYQGDYSNTLVSDIQNIVPIALRTATEVEQNVPSIRSIVFTNLAKTKLLLSIVNLNQDTLTYEIESDLGEDFSPSGGTLTFENDTIVQLELDYNKPETAGVYSYRLILTNGQGDRYISVFSITLSDDVEVNALSLNLPPTIQSLKMESVQENLTLTADVSDDSSDTLSYVWNLIEGSVTINGSATVNPLLVSNYTQGTLFKIRLTVSDTHGASISTVYTFEGNYVVNVQDTVFFFTYWNETKTDLMKLDGQGNVVFVKTIGNSKIGYKPQIITNNIVQIDGVSYFVVGDNSYGYELWRSDGTEAGTRRIKDINPDGNDAVGYLTSLNGLLYFRADDGEHGEELWQSDGTEAGTKMVKNIHFEGDASLRSLTAYNGMLYFGAIDLEHGVALWRSDGTQAGTQMVKDVNPNSQEDYILYSLMAVNGVLYFTADDGEHGEELWRSDGTEVGTQMVKNIRSAYGSSPRSLTELNGKLYFIANTDEYYNALFQSDGTEVGTQLVTTKVDFSMSLTVLNGQFYFGGRYQDSGIEPCVSDGTDLGTKMIKDIHPTDYSSPASFVDMNGIVYFVATDEAHSGALWRTDGTEFGTYMVKDILPNNSYYMPIFNLISFDDKLYLLVDNGEGGYSLWQSDGTEAGTLKIFE